MSVTLRIARPEDAARVLRLVAACHEEVGLTPDPGDRDRAVETLLSGQVPGALYLVGPPSSPVGYLSVSFGYSISAGGTEAHMDELYVRPSVRRRGMASDALSALVKMLSQNGVRALHLKIPGDAPGFLTRLHFRSAGDTRLTRTL